MVPCSPASATPTRWCCPTSLDELSMLLSYVVLAGIFTAPAVLLLPYDWQWDSLGAGTLSALKAITPVLSAFAWPNILVYPCVVRCTGVWVCGDGHVRRRTAWTSFCCVKEFIKGVVSAGQRALGLGESGGLAMHGRGACSNVQVCGSCLPTHPTHTQAALRQSLVCFPNETDNVCNPSPVSQTGRGCCFQASRFRAAGNVPTAQGSEHCFDVVPQDDGGRHTASCCIPCGGGARKEAGGWGWCCDRNYCCCSSSRGGAVVRHHYYCPVYVLAVR